MHQVLQQLALGALGLILVGCAAQPSTQVLLLPQADGTSSAVKVQTGAASQELSEPFQRLRVQTGSLPVLDKTTAEETHKNFAPLFSAAPPLPSPSVLLFQAGGTTLTPESQANLTQTLGEALQRSGAELVVTGHTDTKGSQASNDALSLRRAQQVRDIYIERGFPASRIEAVGRGKRELAVPTPDETDEPRNRRVVILVR